MEDEHSVRPRPVQGPPRLVGDGHVGQRDAELQAEPGDDPGSRRFVRLTTPDAAGLPGPRFESVRHAPLAAVNPSSRSARMSSTDSMPMHRRTRSGVTPVDTCSASVSCEWVVDAGWMARLRTSPTLARWLNSSRPSMKRRPASAPPSMPKARMAPPPRGRYCSWRACQGLEARPG